MSIELGGQSMFGFSPWENPITILRRNNPPNSNGRAEVSFRNADFVISMT